MSTYLDRPLLDVRPDFRAVESGLLDDFSFSSQGAGRATPWKVTTGPRRTIRYEFALPSRPARGELMRFFAERRGRRLGFWLPVYLLDYKLTETAEAGATEITIERVGLESAVVSFAQFGHLFLANWRTLEPVQIASVSSGTDSETITLASPLVNDWPAQRTICGGLIVARPVDDEISYAALGLEFSRATVKFVELPSEYSAGEDGAAPINLYEISRAGQTWRYADCGVSLEVGGNTWLAADITNGDISAGLEFLSEPVELTIATDNPAHPLRALLDRNLLAETYVTIYETDYDTLALDVSKPIYKGRAEDFEMDKKGVIRCQLSSIMRISELTGPRAQLGRICVHRTYDQHCGLNPADWTTAGTITALSATDPPYVEAAEFGAKATEKSDPNWFALGLVTCGTEQRLCTGQDGNRLYLNAPFQSAQVGGAVSAVAGDDRRITTCKLKFDNVLNHLSGCYMPNKNPQFEALESPKPSGGKKG